MALTVKQKAMKIHKVKKGNWYPLCGGGAGFDNDVERARLYKTTWRSVTCKNCLKQKK